MDDVLDEFDMDESTVPISTEGTRTRFTCDLCGFEPNSKNKFRAKQDHLMRVHFMDKINQIFPDLKVKICPANSCTFEAADKQHLLRHYVNKHKVLENWLKEAISEQGLDYQPVVYGSRGGFKGTAKLKKKNLNHDSDSDEDNSSSNKSGSSKKEYSCDCCKKKFFERYHLVLHKKHVHMKYPDEATKLDQHRCDVCGKLFVDKSYIKSHKQTVHNKERKFECEFCDQKYAIKSSLVRHQKTIHGVTVVNVDLGRPANIPD